MKIAFDYDNTLTHKELQLMFLAHRDLGDDVWIVTSRAHDIYLPTLDHDWLKKQGWQPNNNAVWEMAKKLGIPPQKVFFTNSEYKAKHLKLAGFDLLYDDSEAELVKAKMYGITAYDSNLFIH